MLRWGSGIRSKKGKRKKKKRKGFFFFFRILLGGKTQLRFGGGILGEFLGFGGRKVFFLKLFRFLEGGSIRV